MPDLDFVTDAEREWVDVDAAMTLDRALDLRPLGDDRERPAGWDDDDDRERS